MELVMNYLVEKFSDSFCTSLNFINYCNNATKIKDINNILDIINIILPFRTCAVFHAEINNNNKITDYKKINHRSEDAFWENYTTCDFIKVDPIIAQSIEYSQPIKWKDTYTAYRNKQDDGKVEKLIRSSEEHCLQNGITFAVNKKESPDIFIIFSFCMKSSDFDAVSVHKLNVLLPYAYKPIQKLYQSNHSTCSTHKNLTSRELEVLEWITQGKTSWETGKILSISERTVKFHLNNMYQKLNVTNRTQAITTAMSHGLI